MSLKNLIFGLLVLMAISLVVSISMPSRTRNSKLPCRTQLSMLNRAIEDWAKKTGATNGTSVSLQTFKANYPERFMNQITGCPDGGQYTLIVGRLPTCSIGARDHICPPN
jgi:hypothetical protein